MIQDQFTKPESAMVTLYYTEHEICDKPRMRVWTDEMAQYGQFHVIGYYEFEAVREVSAKILPEIIKLVESGE